MHIVAALNTFNESNFSSICDELGKRDSHLQSVIDTNGYPPFWKRTPNFETLIHIILEQQVSLHAAKAALLQLQKKIGSITPEKIIALTDAELKSCYFSRQKIVYAKDLAHAIANNKLNLSHLNSASDETVRTQLKKIKGIGDWTSDVFLMMALQRSDLFPTGDIALIKSVKELKQLPLTTSKETILDLAENWRPFRTIAAYILWHAYLCKRAR